MSELGEWIEPDTETELTDEDRAALLEKDEFGQTNFERRACEHCGGVHLRTCRRIKRRSERTSEGDRVVEVEYWRQDEWHQPGGVIWPEQLGIIDT